MAQPLMVVGDLDDPEIALNLIETVIRLYRESQAGKPASDRSPAQRTMTALSDGLHRADTPAFHDGARPPLRATNEAASRVKYSIRVKDGRTLKLQQTTPATVKLVDFLRANPGSTLKDVMRGVNLSRNTVSNILTTLRKQNVLDTASIM